MSAVGASKRVSFEQSDESSSLDVVDKRQHPTFAEGDAEVQAPKLLAGGRAAQKVIHSPLGK
jgi:hypothetical protein